MRCARYATALPGLVLGILLLSIATAPGQSLRQLRLVSPRHGAVVSGTVPVVAEVPEDMETSFLVFGIDRERPVSMNTRPFVCSWDTQTYRDGPHTLFVEAHGAAGILSSAGPVRVTVRNRPAVVALPAPGRIASRVLPPTHHRPASLPAPGRARVDPSVILGGRALPIAVSLLDGRAYLPVRPLVVHLKGTVAWRGPLHVVDVSYGGREVRLAIDDPVAILNGSPVRLSLPPILEGARTFLPARSCGFLFDLSVAWETARRVVRLGWLQTTPSADAAHQGG